MESMALEAARATSDIGWDTTFNINRVPAVA